MVWIDAVARTWRYPHRDSGTKRRLIVLLGFALLVVPDPVQALQPVERFISSAKLRNPDNRAAFATEQQRRAQQESATGSLLPGVNVKGSYTRNQYDSTIGFAGSPPLTVQAKDTLDAYLTLSVPLLNLGLWEQRRAAACALASAGAERESTGASVETSVVQAYFQLLGSEALVLAARNSLEASLHNQKTVSDRRDLGLASELDFQRAVADVAGSERDRASADQGLVDARRTLESLARLTPEPASPADFAEDDLQQERPLASYLHDQGDDLVAARAAVLDRETAEANRAQARAGWLPSIAGQAQEHLSNVGGITGRKSSYALSVTATWNIDFSTPANVAAQTAALALAEARADKSRRAAADAIHRAWYQVEVGVEKVRSARAQVVASTLARDIALDRYQQGVATQLEVIQAQRDLFSATVSEVQVNADLRYARALLRLSARRVGQRSDAK